MTALGRIGRYELIRELGRGGMATVFRAHDPRFGRDVAIKVLPQELMHNPNFIARFEREAQTIAALDHPAIVPVYDFGEQDGQPYLVMRLMTGGSLKGRIRATPFSLQQTIPILQRVGAALEHAHQQGVVHRDLKPDNILFDQYSDAYLADFGIAHLSRSTLTITGGRIGTPTYMSPEQLKGEGVLDGRSDIYSLGIVLFEMLTGTPPYRADTPAQLLMQHVSAPVPPILALKPELPAGVEEIIRRALAKEREQRYATAADMVAAVTQLVAPATPTPLPTIAPPPVAPPPAEKEISVSDAPAADGLTVLEMDPPAPLRPGTTASQPPPPGDRQASIADAAGLTVVEAPLPSPKADPDNGQATTTTSHPLPRREQRAWLPVVAGAAVVLLLASALFWAWRSGLFQRDTTTASLSAGTTTAASDSIEPTANAVNEEGAATAAASPAVSAAAAYQPLALDDIVNSEMDFSEPLRGDITLEGIAFRIERQVFQSQGAGTPNNRFPGRVSLNIFIPRASRLYLLLNSRNGFQQYEGLVIGQIIAHCDNTPAVVAELQLGRELREWSSSAEVVSTASLPQEVWSGTLASDPDRTGQIDMLTVQLPSTCQTGRLNGLELIDTSPQTTNALDPGLILAAITVEYER
jgi:serine/threonine-protein kinase